MARDATTLSIPLRNNVLNYEPALGQAFVDNPSLAFHLKIAISFNNTDAQTLFTVPSTVGDYTLRGIELNRLYWEITADWTGGASSAIGISSDQTGFTAKGALLGGASGDLAATLVASAVFAGTVGSASLVTNPSILVRAGKVLRFDRITSAYAAGTGFLHVSGAMLID